MSAVQDNTAPIAGAGGGKGGGGDVYVPSEAPNTLQSRAIARVVDLIGEGPCVGLADGLKSVFFNDTPLQNADDSFNFSGVGVHVRTGLPDQTATPGASGAESEVVLNSEVDDDSPVTFTVTDDAVNIVRVKLRVNALYKITDQGDTVGDQLSFKIEVKTEDGAYQPAGTGSTVSAVNKPGFFPGDWPGRQSTAGQYRISGKTVGPYEAAYRVNLSGEGPWTLRVSRITPKSTSARQVNTLVVSGYTEIIEARLTYPDSALVRIEADAGAFANQIPKRSYEWRGLIISVPNNYNPTTRAYTGTWNGTFKQAWSDNPAWVLYDLLTNERYGLGQAIPASSIDKWSLYTIAQYCDAQVDDGYGGQEPRFTCNCVINTRRDAYAVINALASVFRGMVYWSAGGVVAAQDAPADPGRLVTQANVIDGEFAYQGTALSARHTAALVTWNDPADSYRPAVEIVEDQDGIRERGLRPIDVTAFACTSRGQAHRLGTWILDSERHATETVTYVGGLDQADVRPGDVMALADPHRAGLRLGGRLAAVDGTTVTVDGDYQATRGDRMMIVSRDDTIETMDVVQSLDARRVELQSAPDAVSGALFIVTQRAVNPTQWRVLANEEIEPNQFRITALAHDPNKYARVEQDLKLEPLPTSALPTGAIRPPGAISVREELVRINNRITNRINLSWPPADDPRVTLYRVETRAPGGNWHIAQIAPHTTYEFTAAALGRWDFAVIALAGNRASRRQARLGFNILGKTAKPSMPTNLQVTVRPDSGLALTIDPIPDLDRDHYSYWHGDTFEGATLLARVQSTEYLWTTPTAGAHTLWVQAHDTSDAINGGSTPASIAVTLRAPGQPAVTLTYEGDQLVLTWNDVQTDLRIAAVEIAHGATVLAEVTATTYRQRVTWTGARTLTVRARDIAGNHGDAASVEVHPTPPARPQITARVIDNTALFNYTATPGSLPVERFEVRRGDVFTHAPVIAVKAGTSTFTVLAELAGGTYTYGWSAIDTAGNRSPAASVSAVVTQPPDYALLASYSAKADGWPGTTENACLTHDGNLLLPIVTDDTWERHFTDEGWTSPNDQIAAGFPHYMQPSAPSGTYQDTIDYGAELTQALVTVSVSPEVITGTLERTVTIAYSADNRTWTEAEAAQVLASQFRYVRYTVALASTGRDDLATLNDIRLTLDVKLITDAGQATADAADANGTWVAFNKTFIDAVQPTVTPAGNQPRFGVTDFADEPHPTGFYAYLFDTDGHRVSGAFGWSATGFGYNT